MLRISRPLFQLEIAFLSVLRQFLFNLFLIGFLRSTPLRRTLSVL